MTAQAGGRHTPWVGLPLTAIERHGVTLEEAIEEWTAILAENAERASRSRSDCKHAVLQRRYFWTLKALTDARNEIAYLSGSDSRSITHADHCCAAEGPVVTGGASD